MSDGTRTRDRLDHNQELYLLSYAHHVAALLGDVRNLAVDSGASGARQRRRRCECRWVKRAPALSAVAALGVTIAVPAGAATPPAESVAAATCAKETKRLKTFKRGMKVAKKRFFRTHRAKKARARFLKQQKAKLTG